MSFYLVSEIDSELLNATVYIKFKFILKFDHIEGFNIITNIRKRLIHLNIHTAIKSHLDMPSLSLPLHHNRISLAIEILIYSFQLIKLYLQHANRNLFIRVYY